MVERDSKEEVPSSVDSERESLAPPSEETLQSVTEQVSIQANLLSLGFSLEKIVPIPSFMPENEDKPRTESQIYIFKSVEGSVLPSGLKLLLNGPRNGRYRISFGFYDAKNQMKVPSEAGYPMLSDLESMPLPWDILFRRLQEFLEEYPVDSQMRTSYQERLASRYVETENIRELSHGIFSGRAFGYSDRLFLKHPEGVSKETMALALGLLSQLYSPRPVNFASKFQSLNGASFYRCQPLFTVEEAEMLRDQVFPRVLEFIAKENLTSEGLLEMMSGKRPFPKLEIPIQLRFRMRAHFGI